MGFLLWAIAGVCWIVSLVCFVMVLIAMFKNDQTVLGIVCIVTIFCGIGGIIAFIMGWIKASQWDIQKIMLAWTVAIILSLVLGGAGSALAPGG